MGRWQKDIVPKVLDALEAYSYKPTVRGMFYRLVSDELISNTFKTYRSLVAALTIARINGTIPIDAFVDNTRSIEDINDTYWSPEEYVDHLIRQLKNAREDYFERGYIPRWKEQKHYIEVMVEKETLRPLFKQILFDREVRIVPNHGWSSMPHRHPVFNRLRLKQRQGYQIHVLYAGDFDPTGERMARNISLDLYLALVKGLREQTLEQESKRLKKRGMFFRAI